MPLLTLLLCFIMESIALLLYILIPLIDLIYFVVLGRAAHFSFFICISYRDGIVQNQELEGIFVLGWEINISQLADDTTLFLKEELQASKALDLIYKFSCASSIKLNVSKCDIDLNNGSIENIPIKSTVKYLGICITKNLLARKHLNFSSRIVKSKNILNSWLQTIFVWYSYIVQG